MQLQMKMKMNMKMMQQQQRQHEECSWFALTSTRLESDWIGLDRIGSTRFGLVASVAFGGKRATDWLVWLAGWPNCDCCWKWLMMFWRFAWFEQQYTTNTHTHSLDYTNFHRFLQAVVFVYVYVVFVCEPCRCQLKCASMAGSLIMCVRISVTGLRLLGLLFALSLCLSRWISASHSLSR